MKKIARHVAVAGAIALMLTSYQAMAQATPPPAPAAAVAAEPTPEHTLVPKISIYSEYEYRGISQTSEKPAVQFNLDYSHSSGIYLGAFASTINWLKDYKKIGAIQESSAVEVDIFGGYKYEFVKDWTLDVGVLRYEYPGAKALPSLPKPDTTELYAGVGWGPLSAKYSYSIGDTFGVPNSVKSTFIELNYSQELFPKLTVMGQIAKQTYKGTFFGYNNDSELTYTVFKAGASYDLGDGWTVGGYVKGTNAKEANYTVLGKDWSKNRLVGFVSKSF
ncbi:MAG: TorF family putative porin [Betaproteobacteria bacterium]